MVFSVKKASFVAMLDFFVKLTKEFYQAPTTSAVDVHWLKRFVYVYNVYVYTYVV